MKKITIIIAGVAAVCLLLVATGPLLLSSGGGRSLAESIINGRISGSVEFGTLHVSWTGRQFVEGLTLRDADGTVVMAIDRMENDRSLLTLAREWREDLGTTTITGLRADLAAAEEGTTNLTRALSSPNPGKSGQTGFVPVIPFAQLELTDSRIAVSAPDVEEVEFLVQELFLDLPRAGKPAGLRLAASTRQGELTGELKAHGKVEGLVDDEGHLQPVLARVDLTVEAGNLPVEGIDRALGYRGQLSAALGKKLDLQVRTRAALDGFDVDLGVSAPNFRTMMKVALAGGRIVLTEEAEARFTVTPIFVRRVARVRDPESSLALEKAAPLRMTIEKMSVPFGRFDPGRTAFQGTLTAAEPLRFTGIAGDEELEVRSLEARVESLELARRVNVDVVSGLRRAGSPGKVRARAALEGLFDVEGRFQPEKARADIDAELDNVPSSLLDGIVGSGAVSELLGPALDTTLSVQSEGADRMDVLVSVEAPRLKGNIPLRITDTITLSAPARVQATVRPEAAKLFMADGEGRLLKKNTGVSLTVTEFSAPRPGDGKTFPDVGKTSFKALLEAKDFSLSPDKGKAIGIGGFSVAAEAESLDDIRISLRGTVDVGDGRLGDVLGPGPAGIRIDARTGLVPGSAILPVTGEVSIEGASLQANTSFALRRPYTHLQLTSPLEAEVSLSRALLESLYPPAPGKIGVSPPVALTLKLDPGEYPLAGGGSGALSSRLEVTVPVLDVADGDGKRLAGARDVRADVEFDGPGGVLKGRVRGNASGPEGGRAGSLEVDFMLDGITSGWQGASLESRYSAKALPTALLALLPGTSPGLLAAAGDEIDVEGEARLSPLAGGKGELGIRASSRRLKLDAGVSLEKGIVLTRPATLSLTLDGESYAALTGSGGKGGGRRFQLQDTAVIHATLSELRLPVGAAGGSRTGKGSTAAVKAVVSAEDLLFRDTKEEGLLRLAGLKLDISGADAGREVHVDLNGRVSGGSGKSDAGSLTASLVVTDLRGPDGTFSAAGAGVKAEVKGDSVPVALVDDWLRLEGLGAVALGRTLNLKAEVNVKGGSGPITFSTRADNASLDFEGSLKDGLLRMSRPLVGELTVTEELGKRLLNKIHPIFETVTTSREPLRVEVAAEGFSLPIRDFHIRKAAVPSIRIASNRLVLRKGGLLDFLIPLAQSFGGMKGVGRGGETEVWFTTVNAGLRGGVFEYRNRLDMLIDGKLHAISWGAVDLAGAGGGDESSYDLMLGLPAGSLRKILGTKKISDDEVLGIPLRGAEGGLDMKKTFVSAGLDLGRVRGQYEVARKDPLLGLVVGQLAQGVTGVKTGAIPPPSTTPLPWAHLLEEKEEVPPPAPAAPTEKEKAAPPPDEPSRQEEKTPEDALREALPDEMKGVFDLLRKKR